MPAFRELTGNLKVCEDLTTYIAKSGTLCVDTESQQIILHDGVTPGGPLQCATQQYVDMQVSNASSTGATSQLVYYNARANNTAETDPGRANIEWNTTTQSDADHLYVSKVSSLGNDLTLIWTSSVGARVVLQRKNDSSIIARYTINGVVDNGTWLTLAVTPIDAAGLPFTNGADLLVAIVRDAAYLALSGGTLTGPVTFAEVGFNKPPIAPPTVTGSRGGNAAVTSLLTALAAYGLIINQTT